MKNRLKMLVVGLVAAMGLSLALPTLAQANIQSAPANVTLNYNVTESITLSVLPSSLTLTTSGQTLTPTVGYNLGTGRTAVGVIAYFATTTALTSGSNTVPSSAITATIVGPNGGATGPCNLAAGTGLFAAIGTAGATCVSFNIPVTGPVTGSTSANTFSVALNTPPTVVGNYSGTLIFVAAAN